MRPITMSHSRAAAWLSPVRFTAKPLSLQSLSSAVTSSCTPSCSFPASTASSCYWSAPATGPSTATPAPAPDSGPSTAAPLIALVKKGAGKAKAPNKSDLPSKVCLACGRPFTWRKKWGKIWDEVKYCSDRCRGSRKSQGQPESGPGS